MSSTNILRPLGCNEVRSASRHALGFYSRLANTCRYRVPSDLGHPLEEIFEIAIANLITRHVPLRVGIAEESSQTPYFVRLDSVDLEQHIQFVKVRHDIDLLHLLEDEQLKSFPNIAEQPPWKVIVAENPKRTHMDVVFLVHHGICDGRSAAAFHKHLLKALKEPVQPSTALLDHILRLPTDVKMVPSMEEMIPFEISTTFLAKTIWQELGPKWLQFNATPMPWAARNVSAEPIQLHLRKIELTNLTTNWLVTACRAQKTTLTGLIHGMILLSLSRRLSVIIAPSFRGTTPISLTKWTQPPVGMDLDNELYVAVTGLNHDFNDQLVARFRDGFHNTTSQVWEVARQVRQELTHKASTLPKDDIIALLSWVRNWKDFWMSKLGKARELTWEVSNIGSLHYSNNDSTSHKDTWTIDRSIQSQPTQVTGAAFAINVVGVSDGLLTITIEWQEGIVDNDLADGLTKDLEKWLNNTRFSDAGYWDIDTDP